MRGSLKRRRFYPGAPCRPYSIRTGFCRAPLRMCARDSSLPRRIGQKTISIPPCSLGCVGVALTLALLLWPMAAGCSEPTCTLHVDSSTLRRNALRAPLPRYPRASLIKGSTGVAVAAVTVDPNGSIANTEMLEAPDSDISAAVKAILLKWCFTNWAGRPKIGRCVIESRLIFYFGTRGGRPLVVAPAVSPVFEPNGGYHNNRK